MGSEMCIRDRSIVLFGSNSIRSIIRDIRILFDSKIKDSLLLSISFQGQLSYSAVSS